MVNGPAPRFVVDLGRLCFILVLFDAENQVYLILLAVFLLDMELKPKKHGQSSALTTSPH
jgi:penicillin-binding protein-related factor A (putative recombinase)